MRDILIVDNAVVDKHSQKGSGAQSPSAKNNGFAYADPGVIFVGDEDVRTGI